MNRRIGMHGCCVAWLIACGAQTASDDINRDVPEPKHEPAPIERPEVAKPTTAYVTIAAGTYALGCTPGQSDCAEDEVLRTVELSRAVQIGRMEVTIGDYTQVMGAAPDAHEGCDARCPVSGVTWLEAVTYANRLSEREGLAPCYALDGQSVSWPKGPECSGYRLPTESEWEIAARGGEDQSYAGNASLDAIAWHGGNAKGTPHPVGQLAPNAAGLHDMTGNVMEWTWDAYDVPPLGGADPLGRAEGTLRVVRGGSWNEGPVGLRLVRRLAMGSDRGNEMTGFRLARTLLTDTTEASTDE